MVAASCSGSVLGHLLKTQGKDSVQASEGEQREWQVIGMGREHPAGLGDSHSHGKVRRAQVPTGCTVFQVSGTALAPLETSQAFSHVEVNLYQLSFRR